MGTPLPTMQKLKNTRKGKFNGHKAGAIVSVPVDQVDFYIANGFSYIDAKGNVKKSLNGDAVEEATTTNDVVVMPKIADLKAMLKKAKVEYDPKKVTKQADLYDLAVANGLIEVAEQEDVDNVEDLENDLDDEDETDELGDDLDEEDEEDAE